MGTNLEADGSGFVCFNNVSLVGLPLQILDTGQNQLAAFELYPNPFTDRIHLKHAGGTVAYRLHAMDGKLLQDGTAKDEISLGHLPKGLYLLHLSADGKTETKKVVRQ